MYRPQIVVMTISKIITTVHIKDFINTQEVIVHFVLKPESGDDTPKKLVVSY